MPQYTLQTTAHVPMNAIVLSDSFRIINRRKKSWQNLKKSIMSIGMQHPIDLFLNNRQLKLIDGYARYDVVKFFGGKFIAANIMLRIKT